MNRFTIILGLILPLLAGAQSNPAPFNLSNQDYAFTNWPANAAPETYPASMMFHVHYQEQSPGLNTPLDGDWMCVYDIDTRSRVNGLGSDGFAFINTGNTQDTEIRCQNGPDNVGGYLGAAVISLNTTGREIIEISWLLQLIDQTTGDRVYEVSLQYRVGTTAAWSTVPGAPVFNTLNMAEGNTFQIEGFPLPEECDNQPEVQVRWKYYQVSSSAGGSRPQIRFDEIYVTSSEVVLPAITTFYAKPTGSLNELSTWGENPDGSGTEPENFTDNGMLFIMVNNPNATLSDTWSLPGSGSRIEVGNDTVAVTFTIPEEHPFIGKVILKENATLVIENDDIPLINPPPVNSTIVYAQPDAADIDPSFFYGNLVLKNGLKTLTSDDLTVKGQLIVDNAEFHVQTGSGRLKLLLSGDFHLINGATMSEASLQYCDFAPIGPGDRTWLAEPGSAFRGYNFESVRTEGHFQLMGDLELRNNLDLNYNEEALFTDGGHTITVGNNTSCGGSAENYELTGTLRIKRETNDSAHNIRGLEAETPIVPHLNHLVIETNGTNINLRPSTGTDSLYIKGNLEINGEFTGDFRIFSNKVFLGGDFIHHLETNKVLTSPGQFIFNGSANQTFFSNDSLQSLNHIRMEKPSGDLVLNSDFYSGSSIQFSTGHIQPTEQGRLLLKQGALVTGANDLSFVNGPLHRESTLNSIQTLEFPVGKNDTYKPINLLASQEEPLVNWYIVEVFDTPALLDVLLDDLLAINHFFHCEVSVSGFSEVTYLGLQMPYTSDDYTDSQQELRIAYLSPEGWASLGGFPFGNPESGIITSTEGTSAGGLFALATGTFVSVDERYGSEDLMVWPNPAVGQVVFLSQQVDFTVSDISGRAVLSGSRQNAIDVSGLSSGMYVLITERATVKLLIP